MRAPGGTSSSRAASHPPSHAVARSSCRQQSLWRTEGHRRHLAGGRRWRDARHPGAQRRRQDDAVQPDQRRRALRRRPRGVRRPRHHRAATPPALPCRHRPQLPGAAAVRPHDGVREPGHCGLLRRPAQRARGLGPCTRGARADGAAGAGQPGRRRPDAAESQAAGAGARTGDEAEAAAAGRDRRRPDRARSEAAGRRSCSASRPAA